MLSSSKRVELDYNISTDVPVADERVELVHNISTDVPVADEQEQSDTIMMMV